MTSTFRKLSPWGFLAFNARARQLWLLILALGDAWTFPSFLVVEAVALFLSYSGAFSFLVRSAQASDPSAIWFVLLDHTWGSIFAFSAFCFLVSFAMKAEELIWFLVGVLVFPALISHALMITGIIAARLGVWVRYLIQFRRAPIARDFRVRASVNLVTFLLVGFFAPSLPYVLSLLGGVSNLSPGVRVVEAGNLLLITFGFETLLALVVLHLHWLRTRPKPDRI